MKMEEVKRAIDAAIEKVREFDGNRDDLIIKVIEPLQVILKKGTKAGLRCNENEIEAKFRRLELAVRRFDLG